jgi:lipopolysaccharide export LptBFGC system permease protein LptF
MAQFKQFLLVLSFSLIPRIAKACSVCFSGREESLEAYYLTTIFLTLLPLIMLASIGFWLYRQHQKAA